MLSGELDETLICVEGRAGRITLNRPESLNALRYAQIGAIDEALEAWRDEPAVQLVILDGAGERGFCAGGDVRELYDATADGPEVAERFWRDEYHLNAKIHRYPKPIVAIMDGIVMGGGIGLSAHASHRIVTQRSQLAMPETAIGLVPDVGGTYLLSRAPGELGMFLGLTGARMAAADAIYAGFADTHVSTVDLPALLAELASSNGEPVGVTIAEYAAAPPPAKHALRQTDIDRLFGGETLADITAALAADTVTDWAGEILSDLAARSPLALSIAFTAIRGARGLSSLEAALDVEFRLVNHLYRNGEMIEGVRALIVDKDRTPRWTYADLGAVPASAVTSAFDAQAGLSDLGLGGSTRASA